MTKSFDDVPRHPLAFCERSGWFDLESGDIVFDGDRLCRLDEVTSDGDAFVAYRDGTYGIVKANSLVKNGLDDRSSRSSR